MIIPKNKESAMAVPSYIQYLPETKKAQAAKDFRDVVSKLFPEKMPSEESIDAFADLVTGIVNYEGVMQPSLTRDKQGNKFYLYENEEQYRYQLTLKLSDETTIELIREHSQDPDADNIIYNANHAYITSYGERYAIELNADNIEKVITLAQKLDIYNSKLDNLTYRAARQSRLFEDKQTVTKLLSSLENGIEPDFSKQKYMTTFVFASEQAPQKAYALADSLASQNVIPVNAKKFAEKPEKFIDKLPDIIEKWEKQKEKLESKQQDQGMEQQ